LCILFEFLKYQYNKVEITFGIYQVICCYIKCESWFTKINQMWVKCLKLKVKVNSIKQHTTFKVLTFPSLKKEKKLSFPYEQDKTKDKNIGSKKKKRQKY